MSVELPLDAPHPPLARTARGAAHATERTVRWHSEANGQHYTQFCRLTLRPVTGSTRRDVPAPTS